MASYLEIRTLVGSNADLRNRTTVAVMVSVNQLIREPAPTAADRAFAQVVINNPDAYGRKVLNLVLAEFNELSVAVIENATDATLQTAVDAVIPSLVNALAGV